ncbi:hypothetical protein GCM10010377_49650 [Streptomyces viridiviolaceus]|nr:hypothetical protein GCM10010377_49650 [Streptomyces viridiviolaceus]
MVRDGARGAAGRRLGDPRSSASLRTRQRQGGHDTRSPGAGRNAGPTTQAPRASTADALPRPPGNKNQPAPHPTPEPGTGQNAGPTTPATRPAVSGGFAACIGAGRERLRRRAAVTAAGRLGAPRADRPRAGP